MYVCVSILKKYLNAFRARQAPPVRELLPSAGAPIHGVCVWPGLPHNTGTEVRGRVPAESEWKFCLFNDLASEVTGLLEDQLAKNPAAMRETWV